MASLGQRASTKHIDQRRHLTRVCNFSATRFPRGVRISPRETAYGLGAGFLARIEFSTLLPRCLRSTWLPLLYTRVDGATALYESGRSNRRPDDLEHLLIFTAGATGARSTGAFLLLGCRRQSPGDGYNKPP